MRSLRIYLSVSLILPGFTISISAYSQPAAEIIIDDKKQALVYLDSIGIIEKSSHWPKVNPQLFIHNLRKNIEQPVHLYPGRGTNFCAFSALTYSCLNQEPLRYTQFMIDLYKNGSSSYRSVQISPSQEVKSAAGLLIFKGELDINHADQLWFLALADHFKGYINLLNRKYDAGDENTLWAATNLAKFNRMLKKLLGYTLQSKGSDLIRPGISDIPAYLREKMVGNEVFLYLNNTILYRKKHKVKGRIPTHYVVLKDVKEENNIITLTYWDYGLTTLQELSPQVVRKILFGITWRKKEN